LISGRVKRSPERAPFGNIPKLALFLKTDDFMDPQNLREKPRFRGRVHGQVYCRITVRPEGVGTPFAGILISSISGYFAKRAVKID